MSTLSQFASTLDLKERRRLLRLHLIGVPFGFASNHEREQTLVRLRDALRRET